MNVKINRSLAKLREEISAIDAQLLGQFSKRMWLIDQVTTHKSLGKENSVHVPQREAKMVEEAPLSATPGLEGPSQILMNTLLRLSRERQYQLLLAKSNGWSLGKTLDQAEKERTEIRTVAFPGTTQSYSGQGATKIYPHAVPVPVGSLAAACSQVVAGNVDAAVIPLENSTAGTVEEAYSLLEKQQLFIIACTEMEIHHALMAIPGTQLPQIKKVISHPQALNQCSLLIAGMGWETMGSGNTAFAARTVKEERDPSLAALASPEAAAAEGLSILLPQASNSKFNQTRFIAVGKKLIVSSDAQRVSLLIKTANEAGALAKILNVFADLNLDLAKIQSRPIPNQPWHYNFYLDFYASPSCQAARRALCQLDAETLATRLLGWYSLCP